MRSSPADPHPSLLKRKIIHVDMDAFYASIEVLDDPSLKGKPVIVGGSPQSRGVVCTASYEARKFGVRSAMAASKAHRLCPDGIFLRPRFERYVEISRQVREICQRYTDRLEPLSLDESYLDVTHNPLGLYAVEIAKRIRADITRECGLTASAGVAPNKMLAKIASDLRKPDGLAVILPADVAAFVKALPLKSIHGIGPVTAGRLAELGLEVCGDVTSRPRTEVLAALSDGFGAWLIERAQGIDDRAVETDWVRKSFGNETTFQKDLRELAPMRAALRELGAELAETMAESKALGRTITLKARYPDFKRISRALTLPEPTRDPAVLSDTAIMLLDRTDAAKKGVRLLGIAVSKLGDPEPEAPEPEVETPLYTQLTLFGD